MLRFQLLVLLVLTLAVSVQAADVPPIAQAPFDAAEAKSLQAQWSKYLQIPVEKANSLGTTIVLIPPGEFLMGSSDEEVATALKLAAQLEVDERTKDRIRDAERPQHQMAIERPFLLAATEVTIAQFRKFVADTGYKTQAEIFGTGNTANPNIVPADKRDGIDWRSPGFAQDEQAAVSQVTWNDAVVFCNWLSQQEKLPPAYTRDEDLVWKLLPDSTGYRLPTEAEWEFACRAGSTSQYHFGDDPAQLSDFAWFNFRSGSKPVRTVGAKKPNPFGLYDMHGNIGEWCQDYYNPTSYPQHFELAPGPETGVRRAVRGGDWWANAVRSRSAFRGYGYEITRSDDLGFRVARSLPQNADSK